jgi:hypothetical protein
LVQDVLIPQHDHYEIFVVFMRYGEIWLHYIM